MSVVLRRTVVSSGTWLTFCQPLFIAWGGREREGLQILESVKHSNSFKNEVFGSSGGIFFLTGGWSKFYCDTTKMPRVPPPRPPSHPSPAINNDRSLLLIISDLHTATFLPAAIIWSSEQASTVTPSLVTVFLCQVAQVFSDEAI